MKTKNSIEIFVKKYIPFGIRISLRKLNWYRVYLQQNAANILIYNKSRDFICPISGRKFVNFARFDSHLVSPDTGAKGRQRLVWLYLQNETKLFENQSKLLHVAPEYCFYEHLKSHPVIDYVPGDKIEEGYNYQKEVINLDLTRMDAPDNQFDYILCNHVLEHIPDDKLAMEEMYRVLKPGGRAIITVPVRPDQNETYEDFSITDPQLRKKHFGQWDHVRIYSTDIVERLNKAGFDAKAVHYGSNLTAESKRKFGVNPGYIFDARKEGTNNLST